MNRTALLLAAAFFSCSSPPSASAPSTTALPLKVQTPESAACAYLDANARSHGLTPSALRMVHLHDTGRGGIIVTFRARQQGVDVIERDVKVLLKRDLSPVTLMTRPTPKSSHLPFVLSEDDAVALAMKALPGSTMLRRPVRTWRVLFPTDEFLVPAFKVELLRTEDSYSVIVDAFAARVLRVTSLTENANFNYRVFADAAGNKTPWDAPIADTTPNTGAPGAQQPSFVTPQLVTIDGFNATQDPWLASGATQTQGNNVDAYTDDANPQGFSANDTRGITTSAGTFDLTYDTALAPTANTTQRRASAVSAFYVTNWLHDVWYDSGFDEAGGNAQQDNYGRGGAEGDRLLVAVQYAPTSQRNNANASTPEDGESPELHFFLFDAVPAGSLTVNGAGYAWAPADFGPQTFNVVGQVALANDGSAAPTLACNALTNNVAGKIVLADRGTCNFSAKALNAQNAGAIGLIIANNVPGAPFAMNGTGTLNLPVMMASQADGATFKQLLLEGALTATMVRQTSPLRDSAVDNTIVAHEWGHYLHHRLTQSSSYMTAAESEGWADFSSLFMVLRPGDALDGMYPMAQYSMGDPYSGIRRYPYTTDFTKNPLTFKYVADGVALPTNVPVLDNGAPNSEVHNAGELWANAMFGAYLALQTRAQGGAYTFAEARRRMADYVVAGMRLSPANATFTEIRDAVLTTTVAADADDALAMAQAFATRGLGSCAVSPPRDSEDFVGAVESFDVKANPVVTILGLTDDGVSCDHDGLLDSGETGTVTVRIDNQGMGSLTGATLTLSSALAGVDFPSGATVNVPTLASFARIEVQVPVRLATSVTGAKVLTVSALLDSTSVCSPSAMVRRSWHANVDEAPASSATDDVEASTTTWSPVTLLDGGAAASLVWFREETYAGDISWHAVDSAEVSATALVSPVMNAGDAGLVLSFRHRYRFEESNNTAWDGALLQVQTDGGAWQTVALPTYGVAITSQSGNPLGGQQAWSGDSAGWPAFVTQTVNFGTAVANKAVRVRFVVGTDEAAGEPGWDIDDLAFTGATNTPFATLVAETAFCTPPAPVAEAQVLTTPEDLPLPITLTATGGTGALTFTVLTQPANGSVTGTGAAVTYTPAADFNGSDSFTFSVMDENAAVGTATVSLTVTAVNDRPVATPAMTATHSGVPVDVTLEATDAEGDALTFNISSQPAHGALSGTPPDVTYTPEAGFTGEDTFSFTASDGVATSAPATVTVTVIGSVVLDAGPTEEDGGTTQNDGGTTTDGGATTTDGGTHTTTDGGATTTDGGTHTTTDGGMNTFDAGTSGVDGGTGGSDTPKGCGCTSGFELLPIAFLLLFRRRSVR